LIPDVRLKHAHQISAAFPGQNGRGVHPVETALLVESLRESGAFLYPVADGPHGGPQTLRCGALGEQVEGLEDGQPGADQGDKLLVEDEEIGTGDCSAPRRPQRRHQLAHQTATSSDGIDQKPAFAELSPRVLFGLGGFALFEHAA